MVSSIEIALDRTERSTAVTGTPLKGVVNYVIDKETVYNTISLSLICKTKCTFLQRYKMNNGLSYDHVMGCRAKEKCLLDKIYFLKKEKFDTTPLTVGQYKQPFEFDLTSNIPPSFKSHNGEIKYDLKLTFKKPNLFSKKKIFKYSLEILPKIPIEISDDPVTVSLDKSVTKLFTNKTRKIKVGAVLEKGYLIPSKDLNITFIVTNDSDITPSIKTELIDTTTYKDFQNNVNIEEKVINKCIAKPEIAKDGKVVSMKNKITTLPNLYTVRNSKIITREFRLKFTLKLPLPHANTSIEVPIFIGEKIANKSASVGDGPPPSYWEAVGYNDINKSVLEIKQ